MSLRTISLLTLGITMLLAAALIYGASQLILTRSFDDLEHAYLDQNVDRVRRELDDRLNTLNTTARDYSGWDDTYLFIQGEQPEYPETNIIPEVLTNLGVNTMVFIDEEENIVYTQAVDLEEGVEVDPSEALAEEIGKGTLTRHTGLDSSIVGILNLPEGPMMVASRPILTSNLEGPIKGTLVVGTYLNTTVVDAMGEKTGLPLTFYTMGDDNLPEAARSWLLLSEVDAPKFEQPMDDNTIAGYTLFKDIYGDPVGVVRVDVTRDISAQGRTTIQYVLLGLIAASIVSAVIGLVITQRFVITPTVRLSHDVHEIAERGEPSMRVSGGGASELTRLTTQINEMLDALEKSRTELAASEARNRAFLAAIPDAMGRVKSDGKIMDLRPGKEFASGGNPLSESATLNRIGETMAHNASSNPDKTLQGLARQVVKTGESASAEASLTIEGEERDYEVRIVKSGPDEALLIARDMYARRQAEEFERRGVLLREIHHRVKNNLQVVASMINLQARRLEDEKLVTILRDSRSRIVSMGLIHEKLYQSKDFIGVDFADYLRDLVMSLFKAYPTGGRTITSRVDVEPCVLSMEKAIPCGLLVNELVSNALKHAFPDGRPGELYVGLHGRDTGRIALEVRDNGAGLPDDFNAKSTASLGMQLVNTLADQMGGELKIKNDKGTSVEVTFSPN